VAGVRIEGNRVIVSRPRVSKPVAVRSAWANHPDTNRYNRAELPTILFRTDDWPGCTITNRLPAKDSSVLPFSTNADARCSAPEAPRSI